MKVWVYTMKDTVLRLIENAEMGNPNAQYTLALYYKNGTELEKDISKSIEWGEKAANQGYAHAQYYMGNCYLNGFGVEVDKNKAIDFYTKSAEQGYIDAVKILKDLT